MGTDTRRPLAWEILNRYAAKVKLGAVTKTERVSQETQDRKHSQSERLWWVTR